METTEVPCMACDSETSVPTDQLGVYECTECGETVYLEVTEHVCDRWQSRSDVSMPILQAWEDGIEMTGHGLVADEVRYHSETDTALLRGTNGIMTAIDVGTARKEIRYAAQAAVASNQEA